MVDPRVPFDATPAVVWAAVFGALGVAMGAFAAHSLEDVLTPDRMETLQTAVRYQMVHALALLGTASLSAQLEPWSARWAVRSFVAGVVIFSGSLYALVLADISWFGAVTPIGGVALIGGWISLGTAAIRSRRPPRTGA